MKILSKNESSIHAANSYILEEGVKGDIKSLKKLRGVYKLALASRILIDINLMFRISE